MKSPIGLFLAEFRPDPAAPEFAPDAPDVASFDPDDGTLSFALPDETPFGLPPPEIEATFEPEDAVADMTATPDVALPDIAMPLETDAGEALAEARQHWAVAEGDALARRFADALSGFETRIADLIAPMLEPFLVKGAQFRVLDELREALRALLRGEDRPAITVAGPADLLAAIETAFPAEPALAFAVADTPDVTITAGETLIQSRLRDWAFALEDSLGEAA